MIPYLLLFSLIGYVFSFEPSCYSCKFYIPHKSNPDLGLCKVFRDYVNLNHKDVLVNNLAVHCRNNENLCGKAGFLYESNEIEKNISDDYEELKNRCCGEVNETEEIEALEREFFEVFQKIRNHNKKRIYKTTKDLYKLFKKDNK
jgi:hypothetical protein